MTEKFAIFSFASKTGAAVARSFELRTSIALRMSCIAFLCTVVTAPALIRAQAIPGRATTNGVSAGSTEFARKARQLETIVKRRPRLGATFDLWRQHYIAGGRLEQWRNAITQDATTNPNDANAQLIAGIAAELRSEWAQAAPLYRRATDLNANDYYSRWRYAEMLVRLGQVETAIQELQRCRKTPRIPRTDALPIAKRLASLYEARSQTQQALELWEEIANANSRDTRLVREAAGRIQRLGGQQQALELWQKLVTSARGLEQRFDAELQVALIQLKMRDPAALDRLVNLLDRLEPGAWRAQQLIDLIEQTLVDQDGISAVAEFWKRRQSQQPSDLFANLKLAQSLALTGDLEAAVDHYEETWERAKDSEPVVIGLAGCLIQQGEFDRATTVLEQFLEDGRDAIELQFLLAEVQWRAGRRSAAIETLSHLATHSVGTAYRAAEVGEQWLLGQEYDRVVAQPTAVIDEAVLNKNQRLVDAIDRYLQLLIDREPSQSHRQKMAVWQHRTGRSEIAIETWKAAANLEDSSSQLWLANQYLRHGYDEAALASARQSVSIDARQVTGWELVFDLHMRRKDYEKALAVSLEMQNALADQPDQLPNAIRYEVAALTALDRIDAALYEINIDATDVDVTTRWKFALLCGAKQDSQRAFKAVKPLFEDDGVAPQLLRLSIQVARRADEDELALKGLERLCTFTERTADDYRQLVQLRLKRGELDAADRAVADWAAWSPSAPEPHLLAASIASARSDGTARIAALRRALRVDQKDLAAQRSLASALFEAGKIDEAMKVVAETINIAGEPQKAVLLDWLLRETPLANEQFVNRAGLLSQLKQALVQQRAQSPSERVTYTRCLAQLAAVQQRPREALRYLEAAIVDQPTNTDLLRDVIRLSIASDLLKPAIRYQRQLAKLTGEFEERTKLARLLRMDNQFAAAAAIWTELVDTQVSPDEAISWMQSDQASQQLFRSQQLIEAALAEAAAEPVLLYYASLLHLALDQELEARATWKQLLKTVADAADRDDDELVLQQLEVSALATKTFADLQRKRVEWGATNRRTQEMLLRDQTVRRVARDADPRELTIFAAVAWLQTMPEAESDLIESLAPGVIPIDGQNALLLAAWAGQADLLRERILDPTNSPTGPVAVREVVKLLSLPHADANVEQLTRSLERVVQAYQLLQKQSASLSKTLERPFFGMLARHVGANAWSERLMQQIDAADDLATFKNLIDTIDVVNAVCPDSDSVDVDSLRAAILDRMQGIDGSDALKSVRNETRTTIAEILNSSVNWRLDRNQQAALRPVVKHYIALVAALASDPRRSLRERSSEGTVASAGRWLSQSASRPATGSNNKLLMRRLVLSDVLRGSWTRRQPMDGKILTVTHATPQLAFAPYSFPHPTENVSAATLATLKQISEIWSDATERVELLQELKSVETSAATADARATIAQARHALLWWWGERASLEDELVSVASSGAASPTQKLALARYYLAVRETVKASRAMSGWDASFFSADATARDVRAVVRRRLGESLALTSLEGHRAAVTDLVVIDDGQRLASASVDGTVRIWHVDNGEVEHELTGHRDIVLSLAVSPDGRRLASGGYDGKIRIWDATTWEAVEQLGFGTTIRALSFVDDQHVVVGGDGGRLEVWSIDQRTRKRSLAGHTQDVTAMTPVTSALGLGEGYVTSGADQKLLWWDVRKDPRVSDDLPLNGFQLSGGRSLRDLLSLDDTMVLAGDDQEMTLVRIADDESKQAVVVGSLPVGATTRCLNRFAMANQVAGGHRYVWLGRDDGLLQVWDLSAEKPILTWVAHQGRVLALATDPQKRWCASAGFDGAIKLWRYDRMQSASKEKSD